jgi:hypothetical protein
MSKDRRLPRNQAAWQQFLELSRTLKAGAQVDLNEDLEGRLVSYRPRTRSVDLTTDSSKSA